MSSEISPSTGQPSTGASTAPAHVSKRARPPKRLGTSVVSPVFIGTIFAVGILIRFLVAKLDRHDFGNQVGIWDSKFNPTMRTTVLERGIHSGNSSCVIEFHQLPGCTSGFYSDKAGSPPLMYHTWQIKHVAVTAGQLGYMRNDTLGVVAAGERITFEQGTPHTLWNLDNTTALTYEVMLQPCPGSESFYENIAALSEMSGALERINPLQLLVTASRFHVRITELPPWLNRVVDFMLIPLGHAIGIKPIYPQYVSLTRAEGLAREQAYKAHQAAAQVEPAAAAAAVDGSGDVTDAAEPVSEVPTEPASDRSEL